jgi:flagellar basal body rod protein FlgC
MADMNIAAASYEANITVMVTSSKMMDQALTIGKKV